MKRARTRKRRYRQLINQLPVAVLVLGHGRIRFANRAAAQLLGARSASDLAGARYSDLVLSTAPLPPGGGEQQKLRRLDGQLIDVEAEAHGPIGARRVVLRDLARLISAENALKRSEDRLRIFTESVRDRAIVTLDAVGYVVHWNEAALRITGYSSDEIIGRPFAVLFTDEQAGQHEPEEMLRSAIQRGRSEHEGWRRRADGSQYYGQTLVTALFDREQRVNGFAVMLRDLTATDAEDALRNEEQLRQAQRMEAVGRLASGIAHDFNNLLTAIHGHAQFMIEDLPENHPSATDAEEILHSAERAAALTRQLLAFSRGQAIQPQNIDLNHIVTSMERLMRRVITENITLTPVLEPKLWPVCADPGQVEQILVNLVVNARDAMPDGGAITIKTSNAELSDSYTEKREDVEPGKYVMLAVSDTGVGMDQSTQQRIFEPFFTTKDAGKGTGLGLSTVYGIVKQSGGHIFVYSEPGRGTTVKIYLPNALEDEQRSVGDRSGQRAHEGEAILVIEDDPSVRGLVKRVLEARGYHVMLVGTGAEAIRALSDQRLNYSLVVTDMVLPDASGDQIIDLIRKKRPGSKILLMSGYTAEDVRRDSPKVASAEFLEKPFTPDQFAQKVRETLDANF